MELEKIIRAAKWRLTAEIEHFFLIIDKLYKEKQISEEKYVWLTKERPFELLKELISNRDKV